MQKEKEKSDYYFDVEDFLITISRFEKFLHSIDKNNIPLPDTFSILSSMKDVVSLLNALTDSSMIEEVI